MLGDTTTLMDPTRTVWRRWFSYPNIGWNWSSLVSVGRLFEAM